MSPERWQRLKEIFDAATRLPRGEVDAYLDEACRGDSTLRAEVERLLKSHRDAGEFLDPENTPWSRADETPLEGRRHLGDFELLEPIGGGGMGVVFLALRRSTGEQVAVKVLRRGMDLSKLHLARFQREATATASLEHPGIVRILEVGDEDGVHFFAMEYVSGESLSRVLEKRTESSRAAGVAEVVRIAAAVADALHYAHEHGVIHRDVKPGNILIDQTGAPRIVDFGLAKFENLASLSRSGDIAGTPYYMSPEQALAKRVKVDRRTDIFSLGVVLYEMLTLHRPFEGETHHDVLFGITFRDPPPLRRFAPGASPELETILLKAVAKSPDHRYPTAAAFADDLRRFLDRKAIVAKRPTVLMRLRQRASRYPRAVTGVSVVLAVAVVLALFGWIENLHDRPRLTVTSERAGASVFAVPIDGWGRVTGDEEFLGFTPVAGHRMARGSYRIVVERPGVGHAEFTRRLEGREEYAVRARVLPAAEVERGMVRIPAGEFLYGTGDDVRLPHHERKEALPEFLIDEAEVSNREYRAFVDATGRVAPSLWQGRYDTAWDELPVVGVNIDDAQAYAEWANKRLPTVLEWERAARGTDGREYPWGFEPEPQLTDHVVMGRPAPRRNVQRLDRYPAEVLPAYLAGVAPVRSHVETRSPDGLFHALGNAAEWTETVALRFDEGDQRLREVPESFVVKGMGWSVHLGLASLAIAVDYEGESRSPAIGFRCARSVLRR